MSALPEVSICIPAWQAESFIERTLDCAQRQTYLATRILVSVDQSTDTTEAICRRRAERGGRIEVFSHRDRLGWAGNVNSLRDRVATELFFYYFHDDLIEPEYVEALASALAERPDAASANCDVGLFGEGSGTKAGRTYEGSAFDRLAEFLTVDSRGSFLRALTRTEPTADLRFADAGKHGLWANEAYLMGLLARGPALNVPKTLYRRWDKRQGGLTEGWLTLSPEENRAGMTVVAESSLSAIAPAATSAVEAAVLRFLVFLFVLRKTMWIEKQTRTRIFETVGDIHPSFAGMGIPAALAECAPSIEDPARGHYALVFRRLTKSGRNAGLAPC